MERVTYSAGQNPTGDSSQSEKYPHLYGAHAAFRAVAINPGDDLRQQHDRREREVNDEEQIPGDALLGDGREHARAERRHTIEKNVAGDADAVN